MSEDSFSKALQTLMDRARTDADFFHRLIFDPDSVAREMPDDRFVKSAIYGIDPDALIGSLVGGGGGLGGPVSEGCTTTCGGDSCTSTCGARSCDGTCASSCTDTCSHSCTDTTKFDLSPEDRYRLHARLDIQRGGQINR